MRAINISDKDGRDSPVVFESRSIPREVRYVREEGRPVFTIKFIKNTQSTSTKHLLDRVQGDLDALGEWLVREDPEIHPDYCGKITSGTKTVYLLKEGKISYYVRFNEQRFDPQGQMLEEKEQDLTPPNVSEEMPLLWSGRMVPIKTAVRKFVFTKVYQLRHMNGLTFDFLFQIAKTLHDKQAMVLLGAGEDGKDPIRLNRGGTPYRGFLRGQIVDEQYCLSLHLSNMELKVHEGFQ